MPKLLIRLIALLLVPVMLTETALADLRWTKYELRFGPPLESSFVNRPSSIPFAGQALVAPFFSSKLPVPRVTARLRHLAIGVLPTVAGGVAHGLLAPDSLVHAAHFFLSDGGASASGSSHVNGMSPTTWMGWLYAKLPKHDRFNGTRHLIKNGIVPIWETMTLLVVPILWAWFVSMTLLFAASWQATILLPRVILDFEQPLRQQAQALIPRMMDAHEQVVYGDNKKFEPLRQESKTIFGLWIEGIVGPLRIVVERSLRNPWRLITLPLRLTWPTILSIWTHTWYNSHAGPNDANMMTWHRKSVGPEIEQIIQRELKNQAPPATANRLRSVEKTLNRLAASLGRDAFVRDQKRKLRLALTVIRTWNPRKMLVVGDALPTLSLALADMGVPVAYVDSNPEEVERVNKRNNQLHLERLRIYLINLDAVHTLRDIFLQPDSFDMASLLSIDDPVEPFLGDVWLALANTCRLVRTGGIIFLPGRLGDLLASEGARIGVQATLLGPSERPLIITPYDDVEADIFHMDPGDVGNYAYQIKKKVIGRRQFMKKVGLLELARYERADETPLAIPGLTRWGDDFMQAVLFGQTDRLLPLGAEEIPPQEANHYVKNVIISAFQTGFEAPLAAGHTIEEVVQWIFNGMSSMFELDHGTVILEEGGQWIRRQATGPEREKLLSLFNEWVTKAETSAGERLRSFVIRMIHSGASASFVENSAELAELIKNISDRFTQRNRRILTHVPHTQGEPLSIGQTCKNTLDSA